ncbi:hypothetical protein LQW54_001033 [Pestalotiopsis sp. IQ-011]
MRNKLETSRQELNTALLLTVLVEIKKPAWLKCDPGHDHKWQSALIHTIGEEEELVQIQLNNSSLKLGGLQKRDVGLFETHLSRCTRDQTTKRVRQQIVRQLAHEDLRDRELRIPSAHFKTFQWIFDPPNTETRCPWSSLTEWLEGSQSLYCMTGKAGSGKSTLLKYICHNPRTREHLRKWSRESELLVARFYFWNPGSSLQMSKEGMLRSILFDALSQKPALASVVLPRRWKKCNLLGGDLTEWSESELVHAFELLLQQANRKLKMCLFLDGLDEFDGNHQGLVDMIQNATKSPHVKACIASRPWPVFEDAFSARPNLMLHQLTYQDILAFAEESLQKQPGFAILHRKDPSYASQLFDTIATRSEGVFLWVSLVIRSLTTGLSNCDRISDLQRRLGELPSDLEKLYQHMFDSIEDFYVQHAYELLQLAKAGHGSLTAPAMNCADEEDENAHLKATFEPFCEAEERRTRMKQISNSSTESQIPKRKAEPRLTWLMHR